MLTDMSPDATSGEQLQPTRYCGRRERLVNIFFGYNVLHFEIRILKLRKHLPQARHELAATSTGLKSTSLISIVSSMSHKLQ
jgi:hypothetical protein